VPESRAITWEGFYNARDLGGLPLIGGGATSYGGFVRSADPRFVTERGWQEAHRSGIRSIIDLRNDHEVDTGAVAPPGIDRLHVPLDDFGDTEFWGEIIGSGIGGTPLYIRRFLVRKTERCAAVISAIAATPPGGVIYHCAAGRDRTGIVTLLLLSLAGVEPDAIAADYELSIEALRPLFAAMGRDDEGPQLLATLREHGTTVREAMLAAVDGFDAEDVLLASGVSAPDLQAVRGRLRGASISPAQGGEGL
jgi:protein-tyrosine phosphatase